VKSGHSSLVPRLSARSVRPYTPGREIGATADTVRSVTRRQSILLYAFSLWTVWVWGTRIWNIWKDASRSAGFKAVHTVLAVVSVAFAVATWIVVRNIRRARQTD